MLDDFGDQEAEDSEGRAYDQRWEMKKEACCEEYRGEIRRALGGKEELPDDWTTTAKAVRDTARKVLGVSSKQRKEDKETWWWNEDVVYGGRDWRRRGGICRETKRVNKKEYKEMR